jgi:hypothetical protein
LQKMQEALGLALPLTVSIHFGKEHKIHHAACVCGAI